MDQDLAARIDRVESHQAIQQLAVRYAIAVDSRDIETWLELFVDDVDCGKLGRGREAQRPQITRSMAAFYRSMHQIVGHRIEFQDADHARGQVYCRAEHEAGGRWIVQIMCYFDEYERRGGEWFFKGRRHREWYSHDILERPAPPFTGWPGRKPRGFMPDAWPTFGEFYRDMDPARIAELTDAPVQPRDRPSRAGQPGPRSGA